jgi:tRNA (guanine-N7-)-methyltransferase
MRRRKTRRLAELAGMPNVIEANAPDSRGAVGRYFDRARPLVLELGCGRGETTVTRAEIDPLRNFVGVDVRGARLHRGAELAGARGVRNVAFLRSTVQRLPDLLGETRAEEAWLLFPDPFPKRRYAPRRLTSPFFLEIYRAILEPNARVHLKTDDAGLFCYTLQTLTEAEARIHQRCDDLPTASVPDPLMIQSSYESKFRAEGRKIRYICFSVG